MNDIDWISWTGWLGPLLAKGGLLLLLGFGIAAVTENRQSAAGRRVLWSVLMGGLLLMAALDLLTPKWALLPAPKPVAGLSATGPDSATVLPSSPFSGAHSESNRPESTLLDSIVTEAVPPTPVEVPRFSAGIEPTLSDLTSDPVESIRSEALAGPGSRIPDLSLLRDRSFLRTTAIFLFLTWLAGVAFLGLRFLASRLALARLERNARESGASWSRLADHLSSRLGLSAAPVLLTSREATLPMAWGIFRTRILLPENAEDLDASSRRFLLQHELSHLASRDALFLLIAQCAAIVHWPNPLAWLALRELRLAQERACDDAVLGESGAPADYAELLVEIARRGRETLWSPASVVPTMAAGSSLKKRINAILDPDMKRKPPRKIETRLTLALLCGLTLGLASLGWSDNPKELPSIADPLPPPDSGESERPSPLEPGEIAITADGNPIRLTVPPSENSTATEITTDRLVLTGKPVSHKNAVLLKLVEILPGNVGLETARAIATNGSKRASQTEPIAGANRITAR